MGKTNDTLPHLPTPVDDAAADAFAARRLAARGGNPHDHVKTGGYVHQCIACSVAYRSKFSWRGRQLCKSCNVTRIRNYAP